MSARRAPPNAPRRDAATRERLIAAATRLFAQRGFNAVGVRELARAARANVAAVNYHFDDKLGLYRVVVHAAVDAMRSGDDAFLTAAAGVSPEEQLRTYVTGYLPRIASSDDRTAWIHDLMRHEMSEPTPLAPWIAEHGILPRIEYLAGVVSKLLDCQPNDPRVPRCVISIQAQCLFYRPDRFRTAAFKGWPVSSAELAAIADHIVEFSLAGIQRIRRRVK
ncbi:MAG TPA: CerR family C-terminal domain-containing protein [Gemmatimonadaceae bacterium]|nr:CerR family C-terminal domain-containing protein [Gemmatimonadaceae bacterium]